MSSQSVPYAGILVTVTVAMYIVGVVLNYFVPSSVFEIVLNVASLGILSTWGFIVVCQMKFSKAVARGEAEEVSFRMPGAPVPSWLTLVFLIGVLVRRAFDYPNGTWTVASIPVGRLVRCTPPGADDDEADHPVGHAHAERAGGQSIMIAGTGIWRQATSNRQQP
jgi:L-asparagine permease